MAQRERDPAPRPEREETGAGPRPREDPDLESLSEETDRLFGVADRVAAQFAENSEQFLASNLQEGGQ